MMGRWLVAWFGVALAASGCCREDEKSVKLSGETSYPAYSSGQIVVVASESDSTRCSGSQTWGQTPGQIFAQVTLDQPGKFSLSGTVRGVGSLPQVYLRALLTTDPNAWWNCTAGAMLTLPPNDASNLSLVLEPGNCYRLATRTRSVATVACAMASGGEFEDAVTRGAEPPS